MVGSKLTKEQKRARKLWLIELAELGGRVEHHYNMTFVIVPEFEGSKMVGVAISTASEDEPKLRRKVGEYYALLNYANRNFIKLPKYSNFRAIAIYTS